MKRSCLAVTAIVLFPLLVSAQVIWEQTGGPSDGHVRSILVLPNGTILVSGARTFRSTDNAATWNETSPHGSDALFYNGGMILGGVNGQGGVLGSTDDGLTWNLVGNGINAFQVRAYARDNFGRLFAATNNGVFRSTDNGATWEQKNSGLPTDIQNVLVSTGGFVLVGTMSNGIYLSGNNGDTWTHVALGGNAVRAMARDSSDNVYAVSFYGSGFAYSTNGGNTWTQTAIQSNVGSWTMFRRADGTLLAGGDVSGLHRSTDNGANWSVITDVVSHQFWAFAENDQGTLYGGTWGGGFTKSTDNGSSWTASNSGLKNGAVISLAVLSNGWVLSGGSGSGIHRSTDGGATWNHVSSKYTDIRGFATKGIDTVFAAIQNPGFDQGGILRSTDNGGTWSSSGLAAENLYSLGSAPTGALLAGTDNKGVYRSTDDGTNWMLSNTGIETRFIHAFAVESGMVFAATDTGVYVSTDDGASWTLSGPEVSGKTVKALIVLSNGDLLAGTQNEGVYRSTDGGVMWTQSNSGLGSNSISGFTIDNNGTVYASTFGGGVYASYYNGQLWTPASHGLSNGLIWNLATGTNGTIYAGSIGSGVFKATAFPSVSYIAEDFEDAQVPSGWTAYDMDGDGRPWTLRMFRRHSGLREMFARPNATAGSDDWLITPPFSVSTGDSLVFWIRQLGTDAKTLKVRISTTTLDTAAFTTVLAQFDNSVSTAWSEYRFSIGDFVEQTIYIAFVSNIGIALNQFELDDIYVGGISAPVFNRNSLTVDGQFGEVPVSGTYQNTVNVFGIPRPVLSIVSAPPGFSVVAESSIVRYTPPDTAQIGRNTVMLQAANNQGSAQISASFNVPSFLTHGANNVQVSLSDNGEIGQGFGIEAGFTGGVGLRFQERQALTSGGLFLAAPGGAVSTGFYYTHWSHFFPVSPIRAVTPPPGIHEQFQAVYVDSALSYSPIGVRVTQNSYAYRAGPEEFPQEINNAVIFSYTIRNTSSATLNPFSVAIVLDWDVGDRFNNGGGFYGSDYANFGYMRDLDGTADPNVYGAAVLSRPTSGFKIFPAGNDLDHMLYALTGEVDMNEVTAPNNYRMFISTLVEPVAPGDSVTVAFALFAGGTVQELEQSKFAAENMWRYIEERQLFLSIRDLRLDAGGNFWVRTADQLPFAGRRLNNRVIKFNPSLVKLDSVMLPEFDDEGFESMTFDPGGNLWVEGGRSAGDTSRFFVLYKINASANQILDSVTYQSDFGLFDGASGLASDAQGNVWGAGFVFTEFTGEFDSTLRVQQALWKFDNDGNLATGFPKFYQRGNGIDAVVGEDATGIDSAGNVYGSGVSRNENGAIDFALWKFDTSGSMVTGFPRFFQGFYGESVEGEVESALAVKGGAVWVTGSIPQESRRDFFILKYDLNGNPLVTKRWQTLNGANSRGREIAVAPNSEVWVTGDTSSTDQSRSPAIWRYTDSGQLVSGYPRTFEGTSDFALDASGTLWNVRFEDGVPKLLAPGQTIQGTEGIISAVGPEQSVPTSFSMSQNFPNPFNPSTTFLYDVAEKTRVMIQVFDILGRVVGNLVNEVQSPGRYTLVWNASQLPTGVYFMRMQAGGFVNTKKVVVLK